MINNKAQGKHSSFGLIKNKYNYANQYRTFSLKKRNIVNLYSTQHRYRL